MSAKTAATIASNTNPAGPNLRKFSKSNAIGKSKSNLGQPFRSCLVSGKPTYVLNACHLKVQAAAVGMRGKVPDLVHLRIVFCSGGEENVAPNPVSLKGFD